MRRLLILGHGYCARRFVALHGAAFGSIVATRRTGSTEAVDRPVSALDFNGQPDEAIGAAFDEASHILATAPPGAEGDPFLPVLAAMAGADRASRSVVYLSTIGVYGDRGGDWVDATAAPNPASERSRRRLAAEQDWAGFAKKTGASLAVLRLPGIYGPGRSVIDDLLAGSARRIVKPGQVFNRIHVDDVAEAIGRAFERRFDGIVDIVDDAPAPPQDVVTYAAGLLGLAPPPPVAFDAASLTPMARSFYSENKRVSNARTRALLGWRPNFPTYREGLAAILASRGSE
ncbi:MAG TPA: NAD-dependent epimerase/dehydratase family protein [Beijerinckiaceae bacterium]|nr:NAD-dependent epimerase/dehydratase family protein [Beijerinckiaceae bacterium]